MESKKSVVFYAGIGSLPKSRTPDGLPRSISGDSIQEMEVQESPRWVHCSNCNTTIPYEANALTQCPFCGRQIEASPLKVAPSESSLAKSISIAAKELSGANAKAYDAMWLRCLVITLILHVPFRSAKIYFDRAVRKHSFGVIAQQYGLGSRQRVAQIVAEVENLLLQKKPSLSTARRTARTQKAREKFYRKNPDISFLRKVHPFSEEAIAEAEKIFEQCARASGHFDQRKPLGFRVFRKILDQTLSLLSF
jgi:hypothetical protein